MMPVAVSDGYRQSTASWREMLLDLRRRGLLAGPRLATAGGELGFRKALREVYAGTQGSRNAGSTRRGSLLDKRPQSVQSKAKPMIREMWQAPPLEAATGAYDSVTARHVRRNIRSAARIACATPTSRCSASMPFRRLTAVHLPDQPSDRVDLRHGAAADQADEGTRVAHRDPDDGVDVGVGGREDLAPTDGLQTVTAGDAGAGVRRRRADGGSCLGNRDQGMTELAICP